MAPPRSIVAAAAAFVMVAATAAAAPATAVAPAGQRRATTHHPLGIDDVVGAVRVAAPDLSPDGRWVAYTVTTTDLAKGKRVSHVWVAAVDGSSAPRQLTGGEKGESVPCWSPDGRRLAFLANRSGATQVHIIALDGGEARRLTDLSTGAQGPLVWSPDGRRIAFVSDVHPDCPDDACNKKRAEEKENGPKVHHAKALFYRHWNEWREDVRHHVMVADADTGATIDVTPGDFDSPAFMFEDGAVAFAPDNREIAFVSNRDGKDEEAWSTNKDVWTVALAGSPSSAAKTVRRSTGKGADTEPHYTPDGRSIVFRSQERAGFESDRWRLMVLDRASGKARPVFETPDLSVEEIAVVRDGKTVFFTAERAGRLGLFAVPLAGGTPRRIVEGGSIHGVRVSPDGDTAVFGMSSLTAPAEIWRVSVADGKAQRLTDHNRSLHAANEMPEVQSFTVKGAGGADVMSWMLLPPRFDPGRKHPVVFLIHGGPQGAWTDGWSPRWNPALWAAQGWVVVCPNPRGSTGYGQKFVDEVSRDWAGKVMEDLQAVFEATVKKPFVDPKRQAVAGASYGGYAVNWLIGHTDRFKAAVSHDGVFNLESMALATEELWFTEWDLGGPPWAKEAREVFARSSPHHHIEKMKTPTLIITNDLDFRVPVDQGLQLFTALRRRGVPAELLDFPDEGHWVLASKSSRYWHEQVFRFLRTWLGR